MKDQVSLETTIEPSKHWYPLSLQFVLFWWSENTVVVDSSKLWHDTNKFNLFDTLWILLKHWLTVHSKYYNFRLIRGLRGSLVTFWKLHTAYSLLWVLLNCTIHINFIIIIMDSKILYEYFLLIFTILSSWLHFATNIIYLLSSLYMF